MYNVMMRTAYPNEFYHSGVKGQKWGVRRYQNPDGSLTAEGKKRYRNDSVKRRNLEEKATMSARIYVDRKRRLEKQTAKYNNLKDQGRDTSRAEAKLENARKAEKYWKSHNAEARKELEDHVSRMTETYKNKKIRDVPYANTAYGKQVAGKVLNKKDFAGSAVSSAVLTAVLLPTTGMVAVSVPSSKLKTASYARRQEQAQGIKSPIWTSPKKLKRS
jgi:hypothetical protein